MKRLCVGDFAVTKFGLMIADWKRYPAGTVVKVLDLREENAYGNKKIILATVETRNRDEFDVRAATLMHVDDALAAEREPEVTIQSLIEWEKRREIAETWNEVEETTIVYPMISPMVWIGHV